MTNSTIAPPAGLPTMNSQVEGTPTWMDRVIALLKAAGGVVVPAPVHYQGSGYTAIHTDLEGDAFDHIVRSVSDEAYAAKTGRVLWGYIGPMTCTVRVETRGAEVVLAAVAKTGALVDSVVTDRNWTTFRSNVDAKTLHKISVVTEVQATPNHLTGRFGYR